MTEEEIITSYKSLMYNAKANWDYFNYEILLKFFDLYNKEKKEINDKVNRINTLQKENSEENKRCMFLAVEKNDLKEKIKKQQEEIEDLRCLNDELQFRYNIEHQSKLDLFEKQQKEIQQLRNKLEFDYVEAHYIDKDKIREKIKELEDIIAGISFVFALIAIGCFMYFVAI